MFDIVNKYRTPVMWVCVVLMCGFGAFYLLSDLFQGDRRGEEVEIAKFTVPGGGEVSLTNRMFTEAATGARYLGLLEPRNGEKTPPLARELNLATEDGVEALYAFMILSNAAKANGFETTDSALVAELNESMRRGSRPGEAPQEMKVEDFRKRFPLEVRTFWRDLQSAKRFRATLLPIEETTYAKLFEKFKTDYEELRADYVFFDGSALEVKLDPRGTAEDRAALEKWFAEDAQRGVRAGKQIPEQGDFEVLYVRFRDVDAAKFDAEFVEKWAPQALAAGITISDADVEKRFNAFRDAYEATLAAARAREKAESRPAAATDLDAVKERIRRELTIIKLAESAYQQLTRPEAAPTFEQLKALGYQASTVNKLDAVGVAAQADFGSAAAQGAIFGGFAAGTLKKGDLLNYAEEGYAAKGPIDDPAGSVSIWRVLDRRESREPVLDDVGVLDYALEKYLEKKRQDESKKMADDFKKAIDDQVGALVKEKEAKLDEDMKKAIDEEIAKQSLSREKVEDRPKIVAIENQQRIKRNEALDALKAAEEAAVFKKVATEKGLAIRDTGWMRRTVTRQAQFRPDDAKLPTDEKAERFFRKQTRLTVLAGLKKGRVSAVEAEPLWSAAAVMVLTDRREPKAEDLWRLGENQLAQLKRSVSPAQPPSWNYDALKDPKWFALNAPELDRAREAEVKRKATEDETNRKRQERMRAAAMRKAETSVEAMRDPTSPIKSGDDW
jgi:hypothetical protein